MVVREGRFVREILPQKRKGKEPGFVGSIDHSRGYGLQDGAGTVDWVEIVQG
jgi:hypothetical protein